MQTITVELLNENAIHLLQDLELLKIIRLPENESNIPEWHKQILYERLKDEEQNPDTIEDFDALLNELKK